MVGFIGPLLLSECKKHFLELLTKDVTGSEIFRVSMSDPRLIFLLAVIRFDDKASRNHKKETDKLAAIRFILDSFLKNCNKCYSVGEFTTIDEMLKSFRGRCSFDQQIPNKPAKYRLSVCVFFVMLKHLCGEFRAVWKTTTWTIPLTENRNCHSSPLGRRTERN